MSTRGLTQPEWSPCRLVYIIALIYVPCDEVEWKFLPICSLFTSAAAAKVVATQTTLERDVLKLKSCTAGFTCACREEDTGDINEEVVAYTAKGQRQINISTIFWLYMCINRMIEAYGRKMHFLRKWTNPVILHLLFWMTWQPVTAIKRLVWCGDPAYLAIPIGEGPRSWPPVVNLRLLSSESD